MEGGVSDDSVRGQFEGIVPGGDFKRQFQVKVSRECLRGRSLGRL